METKNETPKHSNAPQNQVTQEPVEHQFTNKSKKFDENGIYRCIKCHENLFTSDTKCDSDNVSHSFYDILEERRVTLQRDDSIPGKWNQFSRIITF